MSEGRLRESAKRELSDTGMPPKTRLGKQQRLKSLASVGVALVCGIVIGLIFANLL